MKSMDTKDDIDADDKYNKVVYSIACMLLLYLIQKIIKNSFRRQNLLSIVMRIRRDRSQPVQHPLHRCSL